MQLHLPGPKKSVTFAGIMPPEIRTVKVTRYVTPLREGGSLPAIAEADDGFLYVLKFRGAGQGVKALVAEVIGGELARAAGLKLPEIVFAELDAAFGRTEPDEEIQDLLKASVGTNLALHYLSGAISFDPVVFKPDALLASKIVWLDALLMNVDRTIRNTNMLLWQKELWLIDHGAALYFHHSWSNPKEQALRPFVNIKDHVLLPFAGQLPEADAWMRQTITDDVVKAVCSSVPDEFLQWDDSLTPEQIRKGYHEFIMTRLHHSDHFVKEAIDAAAAII
jgi:hypothetical protein